MLTSQRRSFGLPFLLATIALISFSTPAAGQRREMLAAQVQGFVSVDSETVALIHVRVVDGRGGEPLDDQTVVIDGNRTILRISIREPYLMCGQVLAIEIACSCDSAAIRKNPPSVSVTPTLFLIHPAPSMNCRILSMISWRATFNLCPASAR